MAGIFLSYFLIFFRFFEAVQELKSLPLRVVSERVQEIFDEFLGPDATCPVNVDSASNEQVKKYMTQNPDRWTFDVAAVSKNIYSTYKKWLKG